MAVMTSTTSALPAEGAAHFAHTPVSQHFSRLLGALSAHVEAERDIEDVASFDPAFLDWQRDAECARDSVLSLITAIRHEPTVRLEDNPLKRMAYLTFMMVESASTEDFRQARKFVDQHIHLFSCHGTGGTTARVQQMLMTACARLDELASLSSYVDPFERDRHDPDDEDFSEALPAA